MLDVDEVVSRADEEERDHKGVGAIHRKSRNTMDQGGAGYYHALQRPGLPLPTVLTQRGIQDGQRGRQHLTW